MDVNDSDLLSRLQAHNDYFKQMTDLIPAKYYFEQEQQHGAGGGKFMHNSKEKAPKQQMKDKLQKKKTGKTTTSSKRQRLDPGQQRSVTQIQEEMDRGRLSAREGVASSGRLWRERSEDESESDAVGTGLEDLSDEASSEDENETPGASNKPRIKPMSVESVTSSATIDELREKVRKRIEELRTKRKARPNALPEDTVPKKIAKKEAEKEKKKKAETLKAIKAAKAQQDAAEKAAKSRQDTAEKATKSRQDAAEKAAKKKLVNGEIESMEVGSGSDSDDDGSEREGGRTKEDVRTKGRKKGRKGGEGGVSFSQFDFAESEREQGVKKRKRKKLTEPRGSKDFGRLLKKAELKQQQMTDLKEKDPERALEVETEDKWKAVLDRAQGVKVKDDVELLKKSLKRKEQRKAASRKRWEGRRAGQEGKKEQREAKRRQNIKSKTDARKSKKVKRLQHRGKLLLQD